MIAEEDARVGAVARESQRADAEQSVIDEVAEEDGVPLVRGVGL